MSAVKPVDAMASLKENAWSEPAAGTPTVSPRVVPGDTGGKLVKSASDSTVKSGYPAPERRRPTGLFGFANTEAIKEKVREEKLNRKNPYNVHDCYYKDGFFQMVARHPYFENITLAIIVINALWISIDTDGNTADTIAEAKPVYVVADALFFGYFVVELFIRFCAFENKVNCCFDAWFVFDSTLVLLYAFDPFVIGIMAKASGGSGLNLPTAVLRLFRLARLSRLVRMLRSLPELMIMIKGMMTAARSVGYTLGLLLGITYVFAIALRNVVPPDKDMTEEWTDTWGEDLPDGTHGIESWYFSSVPEAIHNLIIFATFCDDLSVFIKPVKEASTICMILSWLYIALSSLTVMNMLIGVLCEVISAVAAEENESMNIDTVKSKFGKIVRELDKNNDGYLSWKEFQAIIYNEEALFELERVDVDAATLVDVAEDFFFEDGKQVKLDFAQFMEMLLDLRSTQKATVKDILSFRKRFNVKFHKLAEQMDDAEEGLESAMQKLDELASLS